MYLYQYENFVGDCSSKRIWYFCQQCPRQMLSSKDCYDTSQWLLWQLCVSEILLVSYFFIGNKLLVCCRFRLMQYIYRRGSILGRIFLVCGLGTYWQLFWFSNPRHWHSHLSTLMPRYFCPNPNSQPSLHARSSLQFFSFWPNLQFWLTQRHCPQPASHFHKNTPNRYPRRCSNRLFQCRWSDGPRRTILIPEPQRCDCPKTSPGD